MSKLKFERYTFAAMLLILAAIILISMTQLPSENSVSVSGVIVKKTETTSETDASTTSPYIINLNTATIDELDTLPGIGKERAKRIIAYREHLGGYTSIDQIKNISGFGDSLFAKIKDRITV